MAAKPAAGVTLKLKDKRQKGGRSGQGVRAFLAVQKARRLAVRPGPQNAKGFDYERY